MRCLSISAISRTVGTWAAVIAMAFIAIAFLLGATATAQYVTGQSWITPGQNPLGTPPGLPAGIPYSYIWVTAPTFNVSDDVDYAGDPFFPPPAGVIGGQLGADYQVSYETIANAGGDPSGSSWNGTDILYHAILSTFYTTPGYVAFNNSAQFRATADGHGPIFNTHNQLVAVDDLALFSGQLINPVKYDEYGNVEPGLVWTGSLANGLPSGFDANGWLNPYGIATVGNPLASDGTWMNDGTVPANGSYSLYAITGESPILVPEPSGIMISLAALATLATTSLIGRKASARNPLPSLESKD